MEHKINIAELLRQCPSGMALDCTINDNVKFIKISSSSTYPIILRTKNGYEISLTKYGQVHNRDDSKCVIFPKGKKTWEGFVPPYQFNDGDVLTNKNGNIFIYKNPKHYNEPLTDFYCGYRASDEAFVPKLFNDRHFGHFGDISKCRLATEEEKEKLFQAIKDNGYRWNEETKTLEKLPMFKVGDKIKPICYDCQYDIKELTNTHYTLVEVENKFKYTVPIAEDKDWELVPNKFDITTLKPFDKVLVRDFDCNTWEINFFSKLLGGRHFKCLDLSYVQCIPYKGNEHLFNTTNKCDEYYVTWES